MIRIDNLKNYPNHFKTIVEWVYTEFWSSRCSIEEVENLYRSILNERNLPIVLIAFVDEMPAGTAIICEYDPDIKLDLTPWLEGLYVKDVYRNSGVGKALINKIEEIAEMFGYNNLYLSSHVENYYEKLDFKVKMRLENGDNLFEKKLISKKKESERVPERREPI